tara:strand:- start:6322 stop:6495 length:174 start_codon:yes stop_codon:yes gene_type:complete
MLFLQKLRDHPPGANQRTTGGDNVKVLLLLLLLPLIPVKAEQPDIECPGLNTPEMRF